MNICPIYKNLYLLDKNNIPSEVNSDFCSDLFPLIDDKKIAHIKAIRANTPYRVSIRLFICRYYKSLMQNYCSELQSKQAEKKACESNKTDFVSFFVDKSDKKTVKSPVYFLVFVSDSEIKNKIPDITAEIKRTAAWLDISDNIFQCYIFYYSLRHLCNTFHRDNFKIAFDKYCNDRRYSFQFQYVPYSKEELLLNINGGNPKFNISVGLI